MTVMRLYSLLDEELHQEILVFFLGNSKVSMGPIFVVVIVVDVFIAIVKIL